MIRDKKCPCRNPYFENLFSDWLDLRTAEKPANHRRDFQKMECNTFYSFLNAPCWSPNFLKRLKRKSLFADCYSFLYSFFNMPWIVHVFFSHKAYRAWFYWNNNAMKIQQTRLACLAQIWKLTDMVDSM